MKFFKCINSIEEKMQTGFSLGLTNGNWIYAKSMDIFVGDFPGLTDFNSKGHSGKVYKRIFMNLRY